MVQRHGHWEGGKRNAWRELKWVLRWILGLTLRDRKRNDDIRRILGVACITDKVQEARLRWYGHVQRREEDDCVKRILEANVGGERSRGRQRKRWIDVVKHNMEDLQLNVEDAKNRAEWRRRTRVADPLPEGSTAWRRERLQVVSPLLACHLEFGVYISNYNYVTALRSKLWFIWVGVSSSWLVSIVLIWTSVTVCYGRVMLTCVCALLAR